MSLVICPRCHLNQFKTQTLTCTECNQSLLTDCPKCHAEQLRIPRQPCDHCGYAWGEDPPKESAKKNPIEIEKHESETEQDLPPKSRRMRSIKKKDLTIAKPKAMHMTMQAIRLMTHLIDVTLDKTPSESIIRLRDALIQRYLQECVLYHADSPNSSTPSKSQKGRALH